MLGKRRIILTPERLLLVYFFIVSVNIFKYDIISVIETFFYYIAMFALLLGMQHSP